MTKRIITLLCLFLLLIALCACSKRVENLDEFEKLVISASSETQITEPFASDVYVIIPEDCSAELAVRAERLALGIYEKTGVKTYLKYDNESAKGGKDVLEILLGDTSRAMSKDAFRTRKADDYVCMYDRGSLVIGGKSDQATLAALDRFEKDILSTATSASLMHKSAHFEYFCEYDVDTVMLNGFYLYDYAIKADGDEDLNLLGNVLSTYILQKSGYVLDTKNLSEKNINITLDENASDGIATIQTEEQDISIRANSVYGLSAAVAKFASLLIPENAEDEHSLSLNEKIFVEYESETVELSIGVAEEGLHSSLDFYTAFDEELYSVNSDMVLFLKLSETLIDYLDYDLHGKYEIISIVEDADQGAAVVCARTDVSVETELGDDRIYADLIARNGISWTVVILDSYDEGTVGVLDAHGTVFLIREDLSLPAEYASSQSFSFSFGGEMFTYRLVYSEELLEATVTGGERKEIDGSSETLWNINLSKKYHGSFKKLQDSFN